MFGKKTSLPEGLLRDLAAYIDYYYEQLRQECICLCADADDEKTSENAVHHRQKMLRQEVLRTCSMEASSAPSMPCPTAASRESAATVSALESLLKQADAGFTETLLQRIDQTGKKDSDIYKKAGLTKQHFSKIRNNPEYRPTKPTAIALALALELSLEQTKDLIGRAGYALTNSSKFDLIIRYFIERSIYDVVRINIALYEFDQPLLGG